MLDYNDIEMPLDEPTDDYYHVWLNLEYYLAYMASF